ncbi:MAG: hypothetical protein WD749_12410 [Phycisphaerales bacterium]
MIAPLAFQLAQAPVGVHSLPPAAHVLAGLGVAAGMLVWLFGRKLMRLGFLIICGAFGGFVGFFLLPMASPESLFGAPSPYVGMGAGGAMGIVGGIMLFRFAVAILTGLALGMAGVLVSATVLHFGPVQGAPQRLAKAPALAAAEEHLASRNRGIDGLSPAADLSQRVNGFMSASKIHVEKGWADVPPRHRMMMAASGFGAVLVGFILGCLAPQRSAAIATALFGSAVWMWGALWLINAVEAPGRAALNAGGALGWLVVWLTVAALGFAFQVGAGRKREPA